MKKSLCSLYSPLIVLVALMILFSCRNKIHDPVSKYNLKFSKLSTTWDEAIPLGDGMIGALIWEKDKKLRFSLDRADLWDLRPTENLDKPEWNFKWVEEQWKKNKYREVQKMFDVPYDRDPGPSKIPAAAIEFDITSQGDIESVELLLNKALCEVKWRDGSILEAYVNAASTVGWFRFSGLKNSVTPELITPAYNLQATSGASDRFAGPDLRRLGYKKGEVKKDGNSITYRQEGWGGFKYWVNVRWQQKAGMLEGCWSISSEFPGWEKQVPAEMHTAAALTAGFPEQLAEHNKIWENYWAQSDITVPDTILNKQWYLEMYKLKALSGNNAPPISLQGVWTADNGRLPPWKGDFHNDLNTELSYWPAYSSNHLTEGMGFINWMEKNKPEFKNYTKEYFQTGGINVPGVATLTGKPMGGWIQYAFSPTVSSWLAHHYYLQWRYSMDKDFLEKKAYPWICDVATYLNELSVTDEKGLKRLPLSSSPEIFNNDREAWFNTMSNYDLALVRWTFEKASEMALELGKPDESDKWNNILAQWPQFDIDSVSGFTFTKGFPYKASHRHFSHLMAFHPLGLVDWSKGKKDQLIITNTLANLKKVGPDGWNGYTYSWLGNLKARAFDGEGAAEALRTFATCFCLKNSFHANGDLSGTGKSKSTDRPFTLEGNFAFAAGLQEMLIQSHTGIVHVFPAIPENWKDVEFKKLRTEGAFLVSAKMIKGVVANVEIMAEKGGIMKLKNPFRNESFKCSTSCKAENGVIVIQTRAGQKIILN